MLAACDALALSGLYTGTGTASGISDIARSLAQSLAKLYYGKDLEADVHWRLMQVPLAPRRAGPLCRHDHSAVQQVTRVRVPARVLRHSRDRTLLRARMS